MRITPEDDFDQQHLENLLPEPWMVEQLDLNPNYPHWGPNEDHMNKANTVFEDPVFVDTWKDFNLSLDDYNEVVNFYFKIVRKSILCDSCDLTGHNAETLKISNTFYSEDGWHDKITQEEVDVLVARGRLWQLKNLTDGPNPTADEVNAWERGDLGCYGGHDALNRYILTKARAKRLGVWGPCPECDGQGEIFTESKGHLSLILWVIHPRKGASRGMEVSYVQKEDLPSVYTFLKKAAARNAERFSKIP